MEQRARLAALGLSEVEAVEYVLMVSRDEEEQRRHAIGSSSTDEGMFSVDSDDLVHQGDRHRRAISSSRRSSAGQHSAGSDSNCKVQVSPRSRPEPMEAGTVSPPLAMAPVRTDDGVQFPVMRTTVDGASASASEPSKSVTPVGSAWRTPLRAGGSASSRTGVDDPDRVEAVALGGRSFDEELSLAIELSLMDARNGGERV